VKADAAVANNEAAGVVAASSVAGARSNLPSLVAFAVQNASCLMSAEIEWAEGMC
jgi:hypothetical protein